MSGTMLWYLGTKDSFDMQQATCQETSMTLPAIVSCVVHEFPFEARVNWYALWIHTYPRTIIHFLFPHLPAPKNGGFMSEPVEASENNVCPKCGGSKSLCEYRERAAKEW